MPSSSVVVWSRLRLARGPRSSTTRPWSIDSCTDATTSFTPSSATRRSRNSSTSGKLWPVSTCITRERDAGRPECLLGQPQHHDRVLAAREEEHRLLELGRDLAEDVDRLRLERVEMRDLCIHCVSLPDDAQWRYCTGSRSRPATSRAEPGRKAPPRPGYRSPGGSRSPSSRDFRAGCLSAVRGAAPR